LIDECMKHQVLTLQVVRSQVVDHEGPLCSQSPMSQSTQEDGHIIHFSRYPPLPLEPLTFSLPESPSKGAMLEGTYSPNWSAFTAAVAESPLTLSETYEEQACQAIGVPKSATIFAKGKHMFDHLSLPSPCRGLHRSAMTTAVAESPLTLSETYEEPACQGMSGSTFQKSASIFSKGRRLFDHLILPSSRRVLHRFQMLSGPMSKKRVHHGLRFVKSKAKRVVLKTRRGLQNMQQALPTHASTVALDSGSIDGELEKSQVHKSVSEMMGFMKDHAESAWKGLDYFMKDHAEGRALSASAIISERMSQKAGAASAVISERMAQKNLGRVGGG